jgi:hypothetical protein
VNLTQILADIQTKRAEVQKELRGLDSAINALQGLTTGNRGRSAPRGGRRRLSAAARKRISDAQKARWAKFKKQKRAS